jgi:putative peptidoglycan lipid II flippase
MAQATGQAALPFFAKLFSEKRLREFEEQVNEAVYRLVAASFLITALMMAASLPITDLAMRRGLFTFRDSQETAGFLYWFAISLAFWAAQAIYSRGFYSASDTWTPMIAGTIVTGVLIPVYYALFHAMSSTGLVIASDIGIATHTVVLAVLLHRRQLVRLNHLPWGELAKAFATAVVAGLLALKAGASIPLHDRLSDIESFLLASVTWLAAVLIGLWITKSGLLQALRRRRRAN